MSALLLIGAQVALADGIAEPAIWNLDESTTVVLVEDHRAPLVELRVQVPVGNWTPWFLDNHGEEAWTLQHYDPDGALRARIDALAIDLSVYTREQRSVLAVSCLKRDLSDAMELVEDIFANTAYDEAELKRLQQGVDIAWEGNQKDPEFRRNQAAAALMFAPGDARLLTTSEPPPVASDLEALASTRDQMIRLPGRIIGFGGDLTREEVESLSQGFLPEVGETLEDVEPVLLPLLERPETHVETMDNLTQIYFAYLRDGPLWDDEDYVAWRVADHVLGGHFYSRLYVSLRHEGGETYGAYTTGGASDSPRLYTLSTFTRVDNQQTTQDKLKEVLATFHAQGITQQELDDAVGFLEGRALTEVQSPGQVLNDVMWALGNDRPLDETMRVIEVAQQLTVEEVNAAIERFYDPAQFTMLTVEPQ